MRYFLLLLLAFIGYSCQTNSKNKKEFSKDLVESTVMKFPLDKSTSNTSFNVETFRDKDENKSLLVYLNVHKPSIIYFDIEKRAVDKEVLLEMDGPNGVGKPSRILTLSWDSIIVVSSYNYRVSIVNDNGKLIKGYPLLKGENYNKNTGLINFTSPVIKINNKLYFNVSPDRNAYSPTFYEAHINSSLDLRTGEYIYFNNYPPEFKGKTWGVRGPSYWLASNSDQDFIYSFSISDSLVVTNMKSGFYKRYWAGSIYKNGPVESFENGDRNRDLSDYALRSFYYLGIIDDPYRNLYYRFAWHSIDKKDLNGNANDIFNKPLSIIILDRNWNVVGEKKIKDNTFLLYMFFVGEEGLCIANTNPKNPNLEDDNLVFTCFKVVNL